MRFLEILLFVLGLLLPFFLSSKKAGLNNKILMISIVGTLIAHTLIEGVRWQMTPIYLINLIVLGCLFKAYQYFKGNWFRKIASGFFLFLLLGLGFLLSNILPVFELPTLTGTHKVGSQNIYFTSDEAETITDEATDKRELMIKVWYPANIDKEAKEVYLDAAERKGFAAKYGLPQNTFNYLDKIETNTFVKPVIAKGKFPVLIFSHGYYSNATGYYALIEEIVSHGYIVLNINHTYESVGTLFPSGEIKLYDSEYDRTHNNEAMAEMLWNATEAFKKATSEEEKNEAIRKTLKSHFAADITYRWAEDINRVVNQISEWEKTTFLSSHIDTSKIGVFGHSQGGSAAGQVVLNNPKIGAAINIDGIQWGDMVDTFYSKPFLWLSSDWPEEHPIFNESAYKNGSTADLYFAKIKGSGHSNFMDIPLMVNLPIINEAGDIEPKEAIDITTKVVVDFFDKYLNGQNQNLLESYENYPALNIEKYKKPN